VPHSYHRRSSSFFLPMLLMRKSKREAMQALYYFCRAADDAVDDALSEKAAREGLDYWRGQVAMVYEEFRVSTFAKASVDKQSSEFSSAIDTVEPLPLRGRGWGEGSLYASLENVALPSPPPSPLGGGSPSLQPLSKTHITESGEAVKSDSRLHSVSLQLQHAVQHYHLPRKYFEDLLDGLARDCTRPVQIESEAALYDYCYRVAGCVGLQAMRIFGVVSEQGDAFAIALGRALQLTNILRDLEEDAEQGRCYVPPEWKQQADGGHSKLAEAANAAFAEADRLAAQLPTRPLTPALLMRDIYRVYLNRLTHQPHKKFTKKPTLSDLFMLFSRGIRYRYLA
jgi:phytoene/squalene synthetase